MKKNFYISTPIFYPQGAPRFTTIYSSVVADCITRYLKMLNRNVSFITGMDEHGVNVHESARAHHKTPQEYVDQVASELKTNFRKMKISFSRFVRTSDEEHIDTVERIFNELKESGHIYRGDFKGWYCMSCETFWPDNLVAERRCPKPYCPGTVQKVHEEGYFFKLSEFSNQVLEWLIRNPGVVKPEEHRNKLIEIAKQGLQDLCVTRHGLMWGVPVPENPDFTIYVWFDALMSYLSSVGYGSPDFSKYWPADVHLIREDILTFHGIIWPAFCFALGIAPPKCLYVMGGISVEGKVQSPFKRGPINPLEVIDLYGADALRYYLLREAPLGDNVDVSIEAIVNRLNGDLANALGNLFHRSISMIDRYSGGVVPGAVSQGSVERNLERIFRQVKNEYKRSMDEYDFREAILSIWDLVDELNRYVQGAEPWNLHKNGDTERLNTVLYILADHLRVLSIMLAPIIPRSAGRMWKSLGFQSSLSSEKFDSINLGLFPEGREIKLIKPIFPKIEEAVKK